MTTLIYIETRLRAELQIDKLCTRAHIYEGKKLHGYQCKGWDCFQRKCVKHVNDNSRKTYKGKPNIKDNLMQGCADLITFLC